MSDEGAKKLTRQEIYQRIRETGGKEVYILSEMKRLGFWPEDTDQPSLTESFIEKRSQLQDKLNSLGREKRLYENPEEALKELHKQRKKEALIRREEKRKERNEARYQKAKNWHELQKKQITFVGEGLSGGLSECHSDESKLTAQRLPLLHDSLMLANAMGITLNELRFLVYQKDVSVISHYQRFQIAKKTGGTRLISAPMPRLKHAQYWVLSHILEPLALHNAAHGFVPERSIVSNAAPHVGQDVVINLDLKDFFPTITYPRVKGLFKGLGYSEHLATVFALLCTEADTQEVELDKQAWFVANGERFLPQGAPTSPNISNLICRKLDARLQGMAEKLGFTYTRYADDVTFSAKASDENEVSRNSTHDSTIKKLLWRCRSIIKDEGFIVHPEKTRIMRKHKKQEVTGVVVNDALSVDRKTLKRFRALLHQIDQTGPEGKYWSHRSDKVSSKEKLFSSIEGFANFVAMVNPDKGLPLQKQVMQLKLKYDYQVNPVRIGRLNNKLLRLKAAAGELPNEAWWQAQAPAAPVRENTAEEIKTAVKEAREERREERKEQQQNERLEQQPQVEVAEPNRESPSPWQDDVQKTNKIVPSGRMMMLAAFVVLILLIFSFR